MLKSIDQDLLKGEEDNPHVLDTSCVLGKRIDWTLLKGKEDVEEHRPGSSEGGGGQPICP